MERRFSGGAADTSRTAKRRRMPAVDSALRSGGEDAPTTAGGTAALLFPCVALFQLLVERIDGKSAEEFGIEVGGFLWHDLAGEGDVADLRHAARIHQESDISASAVCAANLGQGLGGIADV